MGDCGGTWRDKEEADMSDTITISKFELELMIAEAVARNTLPRKRRILEM